MLVKLLLPAKKKGHKYCCRQARQAGEQPGALGPNRPLPFLTLSNLPFPNWPVLVLNLISQHAELPTRSHDVLNRITLEVIGWAQNHKNRLFIFKVQKECRYYLTGEVSVLLKKPLCFLPVDHATFDALNFDKIRWKRPHVRHRNF